MSHGQLSNNNSNNNNNLSTEADPKPKETIDSNNLADSFLKFMNDHKRLEDNYNMLVDNHIRLADDYNMLGDAHKKLSDNHNILVDAHKNLLARYEAEVGEIRSFLDSMKELVNTKEVPQPVSHSVFNSVQPFSSNNNSLSNVHVKPRLADDRGAKRQRKDDLNFER